MARALRRKITLRGLLVVGGLIATGYVGGGIFLPKLSTSGTEQTNAQFAAFLPVVIDVSGTGSTSATQKYDAFCVSLPTEITGSASIVRATYHNISNPTAAAMDVGFVDGCNQKTESGVELLDNTCTATGCQSFYTTGTLAWQGTSSGKYLKGTISKATTSSFDAKVTVWLEENLGE